MNAFLKTEDYKKWLLMPNDSSAIDEESGDKWNQEKDETLYFIPVLLTIALYVSLVVVFYVASLRARWKTKLNSSLLSKIKRVAQLQEEAETIGSSKTIEQEENAVEKHLQSTAVRSNNKENVTAGGKHLPLPSIKPSAIPSSQASSRIHKHMSEVEPEGKRKENVISSGSSSLPTSSERMASQLPSHTVSHFSSNKSKDFSCKPTSASINEQVDLESVRKGSALSPLVSIATYGKEAKIPTSKQEPLVAAEETDTSSHSIVKAVVETKVKPENIERGEPVDEVYGKGTASVLIKNRENANNERTDKPGEDMNLVIQTRILLSSHLSELIEKIRNHKTADSTDVSATNTSQRTGGVD